MRDVLPQGEGWIKKEESDWTGRGGDFSAITTLLRDILGGSEVSEL